jgi:hypothetical protein
MSSNVKTILIVAAASIAVRLIIANYPTTAQYF